ncbi:MAG: hypothetical protein ACPF84_07595, partial [Flavobacteriales bacterium]
DGGGRGEQQQMMMARGRRGRMRESPASRDERLPARARTSCGARSAIRITRGRGNPSASSSSGSTGRRILNGAGFFVL